ncbi:hypothetical protein DFH09DRAFT_1140211 [Mycena vulgaris]|nr:hypothetical protein DFH09DRAFT_1140211 [Mycena vulgaris]
MPAARSTLLPPIWILKAVSGLPLCLILGSEQRRRGKRCYLRQVSNAHPCASIRRVCDSGARLATLGRCFQAVIWICMLPLIPPDIPADTLL